MGRVGKDLRRPVMSSELEPVEEILFSRPVFIPSHLTKGLLASGVALAATGVALVSGGYAIYEFRKVTIPEVVAFVKPPKNG